MLQTGGGGGDRYLAAPFYHNSKLQNPADMMRFSSPGSGGQAYSTDDFIIFRRRNSMFVLTAVGICALLAPSFVRRDHRLRTCGVTFESLRKCKIFLCFRGKLGGGCYHSLLGFARPGRLPHFDLQVRGQR